MLQLRYSRLINSKAQYRRPATQGPPWFYTTHKRRNQALGCSGDTFGHTGC